MGLLVVHVPSPCTLLLPSFKEDLDPDPALLLFVEDILDAAEGYYAAYCACDGVSDRGYV